jgi:hypothetical protein
LRWSKRSQGAAAGLGDSVISYVKQLLRSIEVTPETVASNMIRTKRPGGHFLAHRHTSEHFYHRPVPVQPNVEKQIDPMPANAGRQYALEMTKAHGKASPEVSAN